MRNVMIIRSTLLVALSFVAPLDVMSKEFDVAPVNTGLLVALRVYPVPALLIDRLLPSVVAPSDVEAALKSDGPLTVTVSGKNTIRLQNVLVGEVWLCSGQSNMQMSVGGSIFNAVGSSRSDLGVLELM